MKTEIRRFRNGKQNKIIGSSGASDCSGFPIALNTVAVLADVVYLVTKDGLLADHARCDCWASGDWDWLARLVSDTQPYTCQDHRACGTCSRKSFVRVCPTRKFEKC